MSQEHQNQKGRSSNIETFTVTPELRRDPDFVSEWTQYITADTSKKRAEAFRKMKRIVEKKKEDKRRNTLKDRGPTS